MLVLVKLTENKSYITNIYNVQLHSTNKILFFRLGKTAKDKVFNKYIL